MKKILVSTLVLLLLVATVVPALAGGKALPNNATGPSGNKIYALAGYVTAIDSTGKTLTVDVAVGNKLVEKYVDIAGKVVVKLEINYIDNTELDPTRLLLSGGTVIPYSRFEVGDPVSSNGILEIAVDGKLTWKADRITLGALLLSK